jgi:hypothetical protein
MEALQQGALRARRWCSCEHHQIAQVAVAAALQLLHRCLCARLTLLTLVCKRAHLQQQRLLAASLSRGSPSDQQHVALAVAVAATIDTDSKIITNSAAMTAAIATAADATAANAVVAEVEADRGAAVLKVVDATAGSSSGVMTTTTARSGGAAVTAADSTVAAGARGLALAAESGATAASAAGVTAVQSQQLTLTH